MKCYKNEVIKLRRDIKQLQKMLFKIHAYSALRGGKNFNKYKKYHSKWLGEKNEKTNTCY